MKKVGFLIFCLFAMCSMAGKAQDVVADSTGYISIFPFCDLSG
jgi:hypothetical protein